MTKYYQATNVGKVRSHNEDAIKMIEPNTFIVADGMGGQAAGEVASRILIETVENELKSAQLPYNEEILRGTILKANENILSEVEKHSEYNGMGTTATILHISEPKEDQPELISQTAYYAHIGDSRLYKLESSGLKQITVDHSYVEDLVRRGELTQEQARVHPMKNVLLRAVGSEEKITVDTGNFKVKSGDIFLLCSDGLTNMVEDEEIAKILMTTKNPAEDLIEVALNHGGKDNISVIVVGVI